MEAESKILLDVVVNSKEALKRTVELKDAIERLKVEQGELDLTTKEGREQNEAIIATIKAHKKEADALSKTVQREVEQNLQKNGAIKAQEAELANLTDAYDSLSQAEREGAKGQELIENIERTKDSIRGVKEQVSEANTALVDYVAETYDMMEGNKAFTDAVERAAELRLAIAEMRDTQKTLDTSTDEGREAFEALGVTIRAYNSELRQATKTAELELTTDAHRVGSLQSLKAELSNITAAYNQLSREERENAEIGGVMAAKINEITSELKDAEEGIQNYRRNVGNYESAVSSALAGNNSFVASLIETTAASGSASEGIKSASSSVVGLGKSALKLLSIPIVAFLAAIVAAVMLLYKAFSRSEEQGQKVGVMLAKLSGIFKSLLKAIEPLAGFLVDGLVYAFDLLLTSIEKVMQGLAWVFDFLGMESAAAWVNDTTKALDTMTAATANLAKAEAELLKIEREHKKARADLKKEANEYKALSEDATKSLKDRIDASNKYFEALGRQQALEMEGARKALEIANLRLVTEGETTDALNARAEALARIAEIELEISTEAEAQRKTANQLYKEAADKEYERAQKSIETSKTLALAKLGIEKSTSADTLANREKQARRELEIQQQSAKDALALQLRAGKITRAEFDASSLALEAAATEFNRSAMQRASEYANEQLNILGGLLKSSANMQVAQIEGEYNRMLERLDSIQPPQFDPSLDPEVYDKQVEEFEAMLIENADLAVALEAEKNRRIADIRKTETANRVADLERSNAELFASEMSQFVDNENERLRVQKEALEALIEQKRAANIETYEDEARLRATNDAIALSAMNSQLLADNLTAKQRFEAKRAYLEKEAAIYADNAGRQKEIARDLAEAERELLNERVEALSAWASSISDVMGSFADISNEIGARDVEKARADADEKKAILQEQLDANLITREEFDAQTKALDEKVAKEQAKAERKKAIQEKAMKVFSIVTSTAEGIAKSVASSPLTFGLPWSAVTAAIGAAQLAAVLAAPLPKAARGAMIGGKLHSSGGTLIEAERGEVIINRKSSARFLPILSAINQAEGGVAFTSGSDGGFAARNSTRGAETPATAEQIAEAMGRVNIAVAVDDIRRGDQLYTDVRDRAKF